jgi:N-methylhydantoinase B
MTDSGGAGKFRGGSGTAWEVEPLNDEMTFITFGEGRRIPAVGAAGAASTMIDTKVGRLELVQGDHVETIRENVIKVIRPGDRITNMNPGGGGYGDPMDRAVEKVVWDVKNNLVSIDGAREDYGVIITDPTTLHVDIKATEELRARRRAAMAAK